MALTRSENMSRIRSADTEPELIVRRALTAAGLRYRLHQKTPGGKADLVMPSQKFALFIDGCFWHGCPEHYVHPRSNWPFWDAKLRENVDRDRRQTKALVSEGWKFLRVWEHEVREAPLKVVERIQKQLDGARRAKAGWRVVFVRPEGEGSTLERRLHEDLADAAKQLTTVRQRVTAKKGRVAKGVVSHLSVPAAKKSGGGISNDAKQRGRVA
ncbi:MAG: very short patch repair endonuclease [Archangium sp.]|nr:very short patch repair endonuclease [Archangium sp.]